MEDLRTNYEKEKVQLEEMTPAAVTPVAPNPEDERINKEWEALETYMVEALAEWSGKQMDASALIGEEEPSQQYGFLLIDLLCSQLCLSLPSSFYYLLPHCVCLYPSVYLSLPLSFCLSVSVCVCLSLSLSICLCLSHSQGCKSFRFSLIFFIKSNLKGTRANLKTTF